MTSMQMLSVPNSYYGNTYQTESMTWNVNGQMTGKSWSAASLPFYPYAALVSGAVQYNYSSTQNNGQITGVTDSISGETIGYQYDALKRLTSASSTPTTGSTPAAWTQSFSYDGFGNLTAKVLNGTTTSIAVNAATNRLSSASYDLNGNMTSGAGSSLVYDEANRLTSASPLSGGTEYYGYSPDNKRIVRQETNGTQIWTLYGAGGERLTQFQLAGLSVAANVWFAGQLIGENGAPVYADRLGTNRGSGARFYPFGDEITSTSNDRTKFGTYSRDSFTGLDYADQRMYASSYGRFNTPDRHAASGKANSPLSWNRYSYVQGDPINWRDRRGLERDDGGDGTCVWNDDTWSLDCYGDGGGDGGGGGGGGESCDDNPYQAQCPGSQGGGGGDVGSVDSPGSSGTATSYGQALGAWQYAQKQIGTAKDKQPCDTLLSNFQANGATLTFAGLQGAVASVTFADGTTATGVTMASLFAGSPFPSTQQAVGYGTQSVAAFIAAQAAAGMPVGAVAQLGGTSVYINYATTNLTNLYLNESNVLHEALHNITGLTDQQIEYTLSSYGLNPQTSSAQISSLLLSKCL
jgi:RHS repeat-associated protein